MARVGDLLGSRAVETACCSGHAGGSAGSSRARVPAAAHPPPGTPVHRRRVRPSRQAVVSCTASGATGDSRLLGVGSDGFAATSSGKASRGDGGVARFRAEDGDWDAPADGADELLLARPARERVGVLLLNLGGPECLDDVQPFLYNLFADPDIIRLPAAVSFLQRPLAALVSTLRAPKSKEGYAAIGGGSPLRRITDQQASALCAALGERGTDAHVYVAMRYWRPFTEDAVQQIKDDRITRLVVLPLYPQFSISTSGSSLRLLEQLFRSDPYLSGMKHTVIPSWYQRKGYVTAMAGLIQHELGRAFGGPASQLARSATIFFSAHGVPLSYVTDAGDPYKEEMEQCVALIMAELRSRGVYNPHTLAYQSRVGPVDWLQPYTDATIRDLGAKGTPALLAVPVSFVSEHIETLEEIDCEYRELAEQSGIPHWGRVPALNCDPVFIADLADAVLEALPFTDAMAPRPLPSALVPPGSVEELLSTYDVDRLVLPPPVTFWRAWGWTRSAETWNGRLAMLAVVCLLVLEARARTGLFQPLL